jgi:hemoglobin
MAPTLFEQLGGEPVLRSIIRTFVDQMFSDPMIGFLFRNASQERVADKEYELAAQHLGGGGVYTGRPIREVHAAHSILGGQFDRRLQILRRTLADAGAPSAVSEHWLAYTEQLRPLVIRDDAECTV